MRSGRPIRFVLVAALLVAAAACSGSSPKASSTPTPQVRPSSPAQVKITSPANGSTIKGPNVHVAVQLIGARVVPVTTKNIRPDEGHIHVKLDGAIVTLNAGLTYDIADVKPGNHVLEVEFVASDHVPWNPRVFTGITFAVK